MVLDDVDALTSLLSDPEVTRYFSSTKPIELAEVEVAVRGMIARWERNGFGRLALIHKSTEKMIGYSGLRTLDGTPELVYTLGKQYWGQGLATEAAKATLRLGFDHLQFDRIVAITKLDNWVSRHILDKIGFCFQGEASYYGHTAACYEIVRCHYMPDEDFFCRIVQHQIPNILSQNPAQTSPQVF